jgi:hypothetical protein
MDNKYKTASDVAAAVQAINILKEKIKHLTDYGQQLVNSSMHHVEVSFEEHDVAHPPRVTPMFPAGTDVSNIPEGMLPIGYIKTWPQSEVATVNLYKSVVPQDVAMKLIDSLLEKFNSEILHYQGVIDKSIIGKEAPERKPQSYEYTLKVGGDKESNK